MIDLAGPDVEVVALIDQACAGTGFFTIVGHGVAPSIVTAVWDTAAAFFAQPLDAKRRATHADPSHPYGYFPMGGEALARSRGEHTPPDLKESFNLAPPEHHRDDAGRFGGVARIWPTGIAGFEAAWTEYYDAMALLADQLLGLFARALGVQPEQFHTRTRRHMSALRAVSYPPLASPPQHGQLRAGAHTDYGTLTILQPGEGTGGLEVLTAEGRWLAVGPADGAFVVNLGDIMARWTDDLWCSTLHRVGLPAPGAAAHERRQAVAFFHQPDWDAEIASLSGRDTYPPIRYGDWLLAKFEAAGS